MKSLEDISFVFLLLYVDDKFIVTKNKIEINKLKDLLSKKFTIKNLDVTQKILQMEIHTNRTASLQYLSQLQN